MEPISFLVSKAPIAFRSESFPDHFTVVGSSVTQLMDKDGKPIKDMYHAQMGMVVLAGKGVSALKVGTVITVPASAFKPVE